MEWYEAPLIFSSTTGNTYIFANVGLEKEKNFDVNFIQLSMRKHPGSTKFWNSEYIFTFVTTKNAKNQPNGAKGPRRRAPSKPQQKITFLDTPVTSANTISRKKYP